jgi:HSP20 family protein
MAKRRDIDRLQNELEELFAELWQVPAFSGLRRGFRPDVDCFLTPDPPELTVVVAVPGVDPEEFALAAASRSLVVTGVRRRPRVPGTHYQLMEIEYGSFERQIRLPVDVDVDGATATYARGLLTIVLPVTQRPLGPVRVPIKVRQAP